MNWITEQNEIKFFEEAEELYVMDRPSHSNNPACSTPNPPWWCNENDPGTAVSIDMYLLALVVVAVLIRLNFKNENKN